MTILLIVGAALIIDWIFGEFKLWSHPVVLMGKAYQILETIMRRWAKTPIQLKVAGVITVLLVVSISYSAIAGIIYLSYKLHYWAGNIVSVIIMSQTIALRSMYDHVISISEPLRRDELPIARQALAMIVGRDTKCLNETEIVRGAVESTAENTVDGITAPIFYGIMGGPALAMAYKAVSTADSMIGYKNEQYEDFGWAGARLDDVLNYIPARLTAVVYLILAPFTVGGLQGVWCSMVKYARKHPSPNSGIPESALAGALQVRLGGYNYYQGVKSFRAYLGQPINQLTKNHLTTSLHIMLWCTFIFYIITAGIKFTIGVVM